MKKLTKILMLSTTLMTSIFAFHNKINNNKPHNSLQGSFTHESYTDIEKNSNQDEHYDFGGESQKYFVAIFNSQSHGIYESVVINGTQIHNRIENNTHGKENVDVFSSRNPFTIQLQCDGDDIYHIKKYTPDANSILCVNVTNPWHADSLAHYDSIQSVLRKPNPTASENGYGDSFWNDLYWDASNGYPLDDNQNPTCFSMIGALNDYYGKGTHHSDNSWKFINGSYVRNMTFYSELS